MPKTTKHKQQKDHKLHDFRENHKLSKQQLDLLEKVESNLYSYLEKGKAKNTDEYQKNLTALFATFDTALIADFNASLQNSYGKTAKFDDIEQATKKAAEAAEPIKTAQAKKELEDKIKKDQKKLADEIVKHKAALVAKRAEDREIKSEPSVVVPAAPVILGKTLLPIDDGTDFAKETSDRRELESQSKAELTKALLEEMDKDKPDRLKIHVIEQTRGGKELKFNPQSEVYKILSKKTPEELAQKFATDLAPQKSFFGGKKDGLNLDAIIQECPKELLDKLRDVNNLMEEQKAAKSKPQNYYESVKSGMSSMLKYAYSPFAAKDKDMQTLQTEFEKVSKAPKLKGKDLSKLDAIKETFDKHKAKDSSSEKSIAEKFKDGIKKATGIKL
jgi:hypothetical protein